MHAANSATMSVNDLRYDLLVTKSVKERLTSYHLVAMHFAGTVNMLIISAAAWNDMPSFHPRQTSFERLKDVSGKMG